MKRGMLLAWRCRTLPLRKFTPVPPLPAPSMRNPRRMTVILAVAMVTPLAHNVARIPPPVPAQSMVIDLVIVMVAKQSASPNLIRRDALILERAEATGLQVWVL